LEKVRYYEAFRCFRAFTRGMASHTPGTHPDLVPHDAYAWASPQRMKGIASRFTEITGIDLPLPKSLEWDRKPHPNSRCSRATPKSEPPSISSTVEAFCVCRSFQANSRVVYPFIRRGTDLLIGQWIWVERGELKLNSAPLHSYSLPIHQHRMPWLGRSCNLPIR